MKNFLFVVITTICLGYVAFCLYMYQQQRRMLYAPRIEKTMPQEVGAVGAQIVHVKTSDNINLEGWFFTPTQGEKIVVFFHGNGWNIGDAFVTARKYLDKGYGLLMVEYRGHAGHAGRVTEQGLYMDARAFIDWLHIEKDVSHHDMIFYGESLGSGPAVKMASEYTPYATILLSSFSSMLDLAKDRYPYIPLSIIMKDKYMNEEAIKNVSSPVLILHGKMDRLANYKYSKRLYEAANETKKFAVFETGNHVNLYDLGALETITDFLKKLDNKKGEVKDSGANQSYNSAKSVTVE